MYAIKLEDIHKRYGKNVIFDDFNLSVKKGEMVAIVGDSGVGKSTLLNMIGLLERPDSGSLTICGEENPQINSKTTTLLQRNILGYLFQNYALVDNMTVNQNLDIALEYRKVKNRKLAKKQALERVGLSGKLKNKVFELSGGEQQRIAIARLMLKPCEIILADEPTGSLDDNNRDIVIGLLKEFNEQGKTILIVTHDKAVSGVCEREVQL